MILAGQRLARPEIMIGDVPQVVLGIVYFMEVIRERFNSDFLLAKVDYKIRPVSLPL